MNTETIIEQLESHKVSLFATKDNCTEAMEYAHCLTQDKSSMTIALMIYHNTLLSALVREIKETT